MSIFPLAVYHSFQNQTTPQLNLEEIKGVPELSIFPPCPLAQCCVHAEVAFLVLTYHNLFLSFLYFGFA